MAAGIEMVAGIKMATASCSARSRWLLGVMADGGKMAAGSDICWGQDGCQLRQLLEARWLPVPV